MQNKKNTIEATGKKSSSRVADVLSILAHCALRKHTISEHDLAVKIYGKALPSGGPIILGSLLDHIDNLLWDLHRKQKWSGSAPQVRFLVVNRNTGLPSDEIYRFGGNPAVLPGESASEREEYFREILEGIYAYAHWSEVLEEFGLGKWWESVTAQMQGNPIEEKDIAQIVRDMNIEKIKKRLQSVSRRQETRVQFAGQSFKRDELMVELIKAVRGYKCQICGCSIRQKDGSFYVEGAHIVEKRTGLGKETPDNILILCPNHHKEFDKGNVVIIEHTKEHIFFRMNGYEYLIDLGI